MNPTLDEFIQFSQRIPGRVSFPNPLSNLTSQPEIRRRPLPSFGFPLFAPTNPNDLLRLFNALRTTEQRPIMSVERNRSTKSLTAMNNELSVQQRNSNQINILLASYQCAIFGHRSSQIITDIT